MKRQLLVSMIGNKFMKSSQISYYLRSIIVFYGTIMLLSCKNDIKQVDALAEEQDKPEMVGYELELIYSDSARIKYKVLTPEYIKTTKGVERYEEFPQGIYIISYDATGKEIGSIRSKYAKKLEEEMLWEARDQVVVINAEGKKLETEQLFWNMKDKTIYSERYTKLTAGKQILEGNTGFQSDQNLNNPVFYGITGQVEVNK